jgi:hypothetical protein
MPKTHNMQSSSLLEAPKVPVSMMEMSVTQHVFALHCATRDSGIVSWGVGLRCVVAVGLLA